MEYLQHQPENYEIDLRDVLAIIRRNRRTIIAIPLVLALITSIVVFFLISPTYEAITTVLVSQASTDAELMYEDVLASRKLVHTYREIILSRMVLQKVISQMGIPNTPSRLAKRIDVIPKGDTQIIQIAAEDKNPLRAKLLAEALAEAFITRVQNLVQIDNVTIVDPATVPNEPVKPKKTLAIVIATILGLVAALVRAFLLDYLDTSIRVPQEVEIVVGIPLLGVIPHCDMGR